MRLRFAFAVARAHGTGIAAGRAIKFRNRSGETRFRHMAKSAGVVVVYRELFVVQHGFAEELDLLHLIVWRGGEPTDCLCLDTIDFVFHFGDLFEYFRC
jgi:hypothetical protein